MISVVPTILAKDSQGFEKRIRALSKHFSIGQIDVLNDTLVDVKTFSDPQIITEVAGPMRFEVHLMVDLDSYDLTQWNIPSVDKVIIHIEASGDIKQAIKQIRSWHKKVFLALNPDTELAELEPFIKDVNGVLFMTVHPGAMGSIFEPHVLEKIREFRQKNPDVVIEVDGGVSDKTLLSLLEAGVKGVAVGSYLEDDKLEERSLELISIIEEFERTS